MKDNYYFDNAATTWPKPEPVYTFMDEFSSILYRQAVALRARDNAANSAGV